MSHQVVRGPTPLNGRLRPPGDKSVSHRALLLSALAEGTSSVTGLSDGEDVAHTAAALAALGAGVGPARHGVVRIEGGRGRLHPSPVFVDCGNSGTGLRLLCGLVATLAGTTELGGDASLSARPMDRVAEPLRAMGAAVAGRGERCLPPVRVTGGPLRGLTYDVPVPSAQVKSCILLAGLAARGETVVHEAVATRTHTEEMLAKAGARVTVEPQGAGRRVRLTPGPLDPVDWQVPGDPSQAAFFVVAACLVPGSEVALTDVYAGPGRSGFVDVLERMGADVARVPDPDRDPDRTTLVARGGAPLLATTVAAEEIPSLDEVPVLAVAAALARGTTTFTGVGELRVKEVDRLAATVDLLGAFAVGAEARGDDLVVQGTGRLRPGRFDSRGDHRLAMAAAVAGLAADGETVVEGAEAVDTSYPGFFDDLAALAPAALETDR
jgi:3-phosphoshikimate 1-carboxyvinyltransferase